MMPLYIDLDRRPRLGVVGWTITALFAVIIDAWVWDFCLDVGAWF